MTLASAVSTCQDHANKHAYDKSSLSEQFRLSMRNESGGIKKNKGIEGWHLLNDIDWQYVWVWGIRTYVCVCVWQQGEMCELVLLVNKVMGVTCGWCLERLCHRKPWQSAAERGVWKRQAHHFLRQHNPWWQLSYCHGNECHLFDAILIYTLGSTLKWLSWSYCMTNLPTGL